MNNRCCKVPQINNPKTITKPSRRQRKIYIKDEERWLNESFLQATGQDIYITSNRPIPAMSASEGGGGQKTNIFRQNHQRQQQQQQLEEHKLSWYIKLPI